MKICCRWAGGRHPMGQPHHSHCYHRQCMARRLHLLLTGEWPS